ncbi:helix-turn-helix domain-containing protein [Prevotella sp. 10(H)]|uniref:AraC family transcriptional regulator n=1 Tax=Prevotella sp. 10(H) TaxID=1158294 RepID=UPI0004A78330|nr:helix-turn-helix domain-containing protein [Prevotella sp. 10(H)]
MDNFQVIEPSPLLAPYVKQYWFLSLEDAQISSQRLIPFGHTMLTIHRNRQTGTNNTISCFSGQGMQYIDLSYSGNVDFISIVFQPAGAMAFFYIPIYELCNSYIEIDALSDSEVTELKDQLIETADNDTCIRIIEDFLLKRLYRFTNHHHRLSAVIKSIDSGESNMSNLAQTACLGYKQFSRLFKEYIGINPNDFIRIVRFQKAASLIQTCADIALMQLAIETGYTDKSHLIREFKTFTGYTPREYLSLCDPYSDYHSLFRSAFLDAPTHSIIKTDML